MLTATYRKVYISYHCQAPTHQVPERCMPDVSRFIHPEDAGRIVLETGLNGEKLRFPLDVWYSVSALATGSPPNRAIGKLCGGSIRVREWPGTVVVLKFAGSRRLRYGDIGTETDRAALSAYFIAYQ